MGQDLINILASADNGKYATRAPEVVLNAFYQFFYYFFVRKTLQTIKLNAIFFFTGSNKCGAGEDLL